MKALKTLLLTGISMLFLFLSSSGLMAQVKKEKAVKEDVFVVVEDMPQFNGGDIKTFSKWVVENIEYPKIAKKNGISGKVYCKFVVGTDGTVGSVKIDKSVDKALDDEVLRVVKLSPQWTAGMQRGKKVPVQMSLPVHFRLDSDKDVK